MLCTKGMGVEFLMYKESEEREREREREGEKRGERGGERREERERDERESDPLCCSTRLFLSRSSARLSFASALSLCSRASLIFFFSLPLSSLSSLPLSPSAYFPLLFFVSSLLSLFPPRFALFAPSRRLHPLCVSHLSPPARSPTPPSLFSFSAERERERAYGRV